MRYLLVISIFGYFIGVFNPIMEIDAMQYASISRELLRNNLFLHFFDNGNPYLDKPPLIFWITALAFKIFGVTEWAYRIPSIFFTIIAIYGTFQFSKMYYSKQTATLAAIILSSCIGFFIMNSDVRTDMYMIAPMMLAIWQLDLYCKKNHWKNLIFSSIAISFSMMGKGPIGFLIPIIIIGCNQIIIKKINFFFNLKLIVGLGIIFLFLFPMSYGLYTQFGLRGLEFFYWTNSFGRVTGSSSWSNDTGFFYLFNVFLYSFLPWTFLFLWAYIKRLKKINFNFSLSINQSEFISYIGFIAPLIMFSLSSYKLPHYIYCVVPFASIITADFIQKNFQNKKMMKYIFYIQMLTIFSMVIIIYSISHYTSNKSIYFYILPTVIIISFVWYYILSKKNKLARIIIPSIAGYLLVNYGFNIGIINPLMDYQAPSVAGKFIQQNENQIKQIYLYNENEKAKSRSFNFYLDMNTKYIDNESLKYNVFSKPILIYTNENGYNEILESFRDIQILKIFDHVRVSKLNIDFFNSETRNTEIEKKYLLKLS